MPSSKQSDNAVFRTVRYVVIAHIETLAVSPVSSDLKLTYRVGIGIFMFASQGPLRVALSAGDTVCSTIKSS